ncbi:MAG: endonuclease MutS2 [Myxococcota bacterium]
MNEIEYRDEQDVREVADDAYPLANLMASTLAPLFDEESAADARRLDDENLPRKTLDDLQWDQVLDLILKHAVTPEARELIPQLLPLTERGAVERRLEETREALQMLEEGEEPPLVGLKDIRRAVSHATREGVLVAEDLEAIGRNCDVASRARRFFENRKEQLPYLAAAGRQLDPCDSLRDTLNHAVEAGGRLSDNASPELRKLRRSVQNQHDRLRSRVDQMLSRDAIEAHLQDDFYTVREDRYVVPVRIGAKSKVPGIVHGYSSSGQTAFIEPSELVELNNQLRWAQIELEEEENRILHELSAKVASHASKLERNTEVSAYLDLIVSGAKFGLDIDGNIPVISEGDIALQRARHPLLWVKNRRVVDGEEVNETVPNDLVLDREKRVFVISGPNTGGKTVLLKMLGLSALLARCGLPIPADQGSELPLFDSIFTDIGDEQSIERDLSTFSGHLTNINTFLSRCGPDSLVLLDELFTGTDPLQGAALAVALLEDLADRKSRTAVTTHLEGLKTLAVQNERFANASMGFDLDELEPTYQLTLGIPGSSFAVRIASRLGFPQDLVDRSLEILEGEDHHSVDEVLASLEDQLGELRSEQHRLEQERRHAEKSKKKFQEKYQKLREKERGMVHDETRELRKKLSEARDLIRERIKEVKLSGRVEKGRELSQAELNRIQDELKDAEETVEEARDRSKPPESTPEGLVRVDPDELEPGQRVFVRSFNREGDVLDVDGEQARVQVGALKASVDLEDVFYASEKQRQKQSRGRSGSKQRPEEPAPEPRSTTSIPQLDANTVDLRGLHVDEALEKLDMFLDSAFLENRAGVHIIHGHGTGALKRAVRGYLVDSRYVEDFRPGKKGEGGDGVTVAAMAHEVSH